LFDPSNTVSNVLLQVLNRAGCILGVLRVAAFEKTAPLGVLPQLNVTGSTSCNWSEYIVYKRSDLTATVGKHTARPTRLSPSIKEVGSKLRVLP
jgi:hypothetical protein